MKTTLTRSDSEGWFLCDFILDAQRFESRMRFWDGKNLRCDPKGMRLCLSDYTNFRRMVPATESTGPQGSLATNEKTIGKTHAKAKKQ